MSSLLPLMSASVTSPLLRNARLLIVSSCMIKEQQPIVEEWCKDRVGLHVCLQEHHMDGVGFKVATIALKAQPSSITLLTMNGSPHCVQLHFAVEQARQLASYKGSVEHFVVEKGRVFKVSEEAVKAARHLASIEALLQLKRRSQQA